jgi:phytoene dehydrogenase-like protein
MNAPRPVVIGAGVNGLAAAFAMARAGLRPVVLERREAVGGAATTHELVPGVRVPRLAHAIGPIRGDVASAMDLTGLGVRLIEPEVSSFTPTGDGRAVVLARDPWKAARDLHAFSEADAAHYPRFLAGLATAAALAADLAQAPPPSLDSTSATELWSLLKTGRRFRALGREQAMRILRWLPMPVADLVEDYFETEALRATIAARGVFGTGLGPRSAGTVATMIVQAAAHAASPLAPVFVHGGPGALAAAMAAAATRAGAEIRVNADVSRLDVRDGVVRAVVLAGGEEIPASVVVSNADPKRTLLGLVDPAWLDPTVLLRLRNFRTKGTVAKLNVVLDGLPSFTAASGLPHGLTPEQALGGRIIVAPTVEHIDRAFDASKYGAWSERPWLECTIPTIADPSLATGGRHVLSVYAQYAPHALRSGSWSAARDAFTRAVLGVLSEHAPGIESRIVASELLTPDDLERAHGLTGGHVHHGEMALDQLFLMRPLLGYAQHRTPIRGLYLCGAGTHPGGGITGANGTNAARVVVSDLTGRRGG